jgi:hypothetical protein
VPRSLDALDPLLALLACRDTDNGRYNIGGNCNASVEALIGQSQLENDAGERSNLGFRPSVGELGNACCAAAPATGTDGNVKTVRREILKDGRVRSEEFVKHSK